MGRKEKSTGGSVIIKNESMKKEPAAKAFFKGRLLQPIGVDKPLVIEIFGEQKTLMSEPVKRVEVQK